MPLQRQLMADALNTTDRRSALSRVVDTRTSGSTGLTAIVRQAEDQPPVAPRSLLIEFRRGPGLCALLEWAMAESLDDVMWRTDRFHRR